MLSTSFEFRRKISQNSKVLLKATLTLADGTVRELTGDDFMMGSASFSEGTSSGSSFDIGAAIIGKLSVTLNNYDGRFDEYDFTGATIVPYIGVELDAGGVEWLMKGHYGVEQPESYGTTIGLECLDNLRLLERPYSDVKTAYPATILVIVSDICRTCGVTLANSSFDNGDYLVPLRPDDEKLTCLRVLSCAAQVSGNFAKCDPAGRIELRWYNTGAFEREDWLDGEEFDDSSPYASGDTADGGDFLNYSSGDSYDGGSFESQHATLFAISRMTVGTDDVVVTGVSVTANDEVAADGTDGRDGETALFGSNGYVLDVSGNELIAFGEAANVAELIGQRVVGMRFRAFDISAVGDPAIEAGDAAMIIDRNQNSYRTYITSVKYKVGSYEAFSCDAETPARNAASGYSATTKAIVAARNAVKKERTARELAIKNLERELEESSGFFITNELQPDGSSIYYMHDKPTLAESTYIWKLTANAFGISSDGGLTYPYGVDVSGHAILERISAVEIDTEFILAGQRIVIGKQAAGQYNTVISPNAMTVRKHTDEHFSITTRDSTYEGVTTVYSTMIMPNMWLQSSTNRTTRMYNHMGFGLIAYDGSTRYSEWNGEYSYEVTVNSQLDPNTGDAPMLWLGPSGTAVDDSGSWYASLKASSGAYLTFTKDSPYSIVANAVLSANQLNTTVRGDMYFTCLGKNDTTPTIYLRVNKSSQSELPVELKISRSGIEATAESLPVKLTADTLNLAGVSYMTLPNNHRFDLRNGLAIYSTDSSSNPQSSTARIYPDAEGHIHVCGGARSQATGSQRFVKLDGNIQLQSTARVFVGDAVAASTTLLVGSGYSGGTYISLEIENGLIVGITKH